MGRMTTKERVLSIIERSKDSTFLRNEFDRFGSYRQVSRALGELVAEGALVRVGYGVYVKTRPSTLSGKPVPAETLQNVAFEAMRKLGVKAEPGNAAKALSEGRSTQVPMPAVVNVGKARVARRLSLGNKTVVYEKSRQEGSS